MSTNYPRPYKKTIRLTEDGGWLLEELCRRKGLDPSQCVESAIRAWAASSRVILPGESNGH